MCIFDSNKYVNNKKEGIVVFSLQQLECAYYMYIAYFVPWDLVRTNFSPKKVIIYD
jgi:hypothetical protein